MVPTGTEATFKVKAKGDGLTFQWQKNGSDIHNDNKYSGTDTNTLRIQHINKSDEGCYSSLVRNEIEKNGILSEEAQLSVCKFKFTYCVNAVMKLQCIEALTWYITFCEN